ncbi:hypothetical protein [Acinetobacter sp. CFCC 10889]|uniref:hypothetical protein n=1 Tax=Acinetobacter sp. CFCC 10889 TaxID=1775557 RepID=UPI000DD0809F|nr:hypothetical protein [Acinetobacter sp. CFCC 10889]
MTIVLMIENPINEIEQSTIPISTEAFFTKAWQPLAKTLKLEWVPIFQTGIFISFSDKNNVLTELNLLLNNLNLISLLDSEIAYFSERLNLLIKSINSIFDLRENIVLYIG